MTNLNALCDPGHSTYSVIGVVKGMDLYGNPPVVKHGDEAALIVLFIKSNSSKKEKICDFRFFDLVSFLLLVFWHFLIMQEIL
jgi:hypothetical protein